MTFRGDSPAARLTDFCTGHGSCRPRMAIEGSGNVFINSLPAHREGDVWEVHCSHASVLAAGSPTVYVNSRQLGRIGDPVACGSLVATGSRNVYVGGGVWQL